MSPSKGQEKTSSVPPRAAFILVGPTAAGKSAVAQYIAETQKWDVLSADSMLVYRGMDIGTAKPTMDERARVPYGGVDLANPDEPFSVGQYIQHARGFVGDNLERRNPLIVTGGTGLYVKCLTEGLAARPAANPVLRVWAEDLLETEGVAALQKALADRDPKRYETLKDKANPRRLIRALELAGTDSGAKTWSTTPSIPMIGLEIDPQQLSTRIQIRVRGMYDSGLLEEVERLLSSYANLSETASQAIGYAEAIAVRQGRMSLDDALARTATRTRQLAKRQMTWFRHQANVIWISVKKNSTIEQLAGQVLAQWKYYGPTPIVS